MENVIEINGLVKKFDELTAVDSLSLSIAYDEVFGIVGPDGAGKTTLIRMLCGLIDPDGGNASILGLNLFKQKDKIKNEIGYLSQRFSLYADLTIDENIEFFADIHGVKKFEARREELLEFTRLTKFRKFLAGKLSGGMKQKLALACTLIHKPKIIFLDEPTTGVDPVSRRDFWKILSELHREGVTIVISTPYMDEAERFDRIALVNKGKALIVDSPAAVKKSMKKQILELQCGDLRKAYKILLVESDYEIQLFGDRIDIAIDNPETDTNKITGLLRNKNIKVINMRVKPVSLENVFIYLLKETQPQPFPKGERQMEKAL
ncbi:MAG TPA: ABC transporter ATP-binding protein [Ignavibacteria bacterium]